MVIRIIGTGSWASALCQVLVDNKQDAMMIGINKDEIDDININHHNTKFFDTEINHGVRASGDYQLLSDADIILIAVPSSVIEIVLNKVKDYIKKPIYVINVSKGFDQKTKKRLSVLIKEVMGDKLVDVISLIGPSHAEEVIERSLTTVNSVCENDKSALMIQKLFSNQYFRVYRGNDVIGAEIGSAVKNIMAIASGVLEGLKQGDNAKAALMTRGLAEMTRFGVYFGAKKETFLGLNGVGDLIVTCSSHHSRNFQAGLLIGKNNGANDFLATNNKTTEGVYACKIVYELAKEHGIDMPITEAVYQVLYNDIAPSDVIEGLMARDLKAEII